MEYLELDTETLERIEYEVISHEYDVEVEG